MGGTSHPSFGQFHYQASGATVLNANAIYWILFDSSSPTTYAVAAETAGIGISTGATIGYKYSIDHGSSWVNFPYTVNMAVNGNVVPEPHFGILAVGFVACMLVKISRK
jgi:hypothetical protein